MINFTFDEDELKTIFLKEVQKRLNDLEQKTLLMGSKELCKMLSLSWPTIEKKFISKPDFPAKRVGKKWVFHRKEVEDYINRWWKKGGVFDLD